ncbi:MAG: hypothetical protein ACRD0M_05240 [Acidimicrobiales bacterium]
MTLAEVIDEHFLARYRALLDAEDVAFDELEHAYEEGDRAHFEMDLKAWHLAIERKLAYLRRLGIEIDAAAGALNGAVAAAGARA